MKAIKAMKAMKAMMNSVEETKCLALPTGEISSGKGNETIFVLL